MTSDDADVQRAIEQVELAEQELRAARARLMAIRDNVPEPSSGSAIRFHVRYSPNGEPYTYIAYRAPAHHWFVTGKDGWIPWESVVKMMRRDYRVKAGTARLSFYFIPADSSAWEKVTMA